MLQPSKNIIFSCSCCSCTIFVFTSYWLYTQAMVILILSMFNTYRMLFLALENAWIVKITPQQIFPTRWKNTSPHQNFPFPLTGRRDFPPTSLMLFGTPWHVSPFHHEVKKWIPHISQFVCEMWLVNTPKNEMSLTVLSVIGNGFLMSTWKY